jgi:hypothetical protein
LIKVCDAIMGTGKSSAAINFMNEHKKDKFIYITPYLEEVERIKNSCPDLWFVEPSNKIEKYDYRKGEHTAALIEQGRNIATTHQAFKSYTPEMLDNIREQGYRLIIDENVDVLEKYDFHPDDMRIALNSGLVSKIGDMYYLVDEDYNGRFYRELVQFLKVRQLIQIEDSSGIHLFYWLLPPELVTAFKDVIILTYIFEGQSLHHFLEMYGLPYDYIGIQKDENGQYHFCECPGYTPEYVGKLKDMIHILDNDKLNAIGDDTHALSMSWFDKNRKNPEELKKNVYNCINNIWRDAPASEKMWGTYNDCRNKVSGKGYTKSFIRFNMKATNQYRNKHYMIYLVNLFMNVSDKIFYNQHGIEVDDSLYALSIMVQWIWRSAIRDGDEIYLYIPSRRMRNLLTDWINKVSERGNVLAS